MGESNRIVPVLYRDTNIKAFRISPISVFLMLVALLKIDI